MPQLIQLRQRITAIETIKKTTNAMRLISMSMLSRLRAQKAHFDRYKHEVDNLLAEVILLVPSAATHQVISQESNRHLIIIVGSQKGLAGVFNVGLAQFFMEEALPLPKSTELVAVGKQIIQFLRAHSIIPDNTYPTFSASNFITIAHDLVQKITNTPYATVTIYSTYPRTFFIQKPHKTRIVPFTPPLSTAPARQHTVHNYIWEQSPEATYEYLLKLSRKVMLQQALLESLLAEQSSRFLSMDAATRNADNLLATMRLDYNRLRQANITRELTDLVGSTLATES